MKAIRMHALWRSGGFSASKTFRRLTRVRTRFETKVHATGVKPAVGRSELAI
jgi:hypothetical protein